MESSPVVRGGVVLNKNENICNYNKSDISQAVSSAVACLVLLGLSAGAQADILSGINGSRTLDNGNTWVFNAGTTINGELSILNADLTNISEGHGTTTGTLTVNGDFIAQTNNRGVHFGNSSSLVITGNAKFTNAQNFILADAAQFSVGNQLSLANSSVTQSGGSIRSKEVILQSGSKYVAQTGVSQFTADTDFQITGSSKMTVNQGATLNLSSGTGVRVTDSATLETLGTTNVTGALTVSDGGILSFKNTAQEGILSTDSSITLGQNGSLEVVENGKALIKSTTGDLIISGDGKATVGTGGELTLSAQSGSVTLGQTSIAGKVIVDNNKLVLAKTGTFEGTNVAPAALTAKSLEADTGSSLVVGAGKVGSVTVQDLLDLTQADTQVSGMLTLKSTNETTKIGTATVKEGGLLSVEGKLLGGSNAVVKLTGTENSVAVFKAADYSDYEGDIVTVDNEYGLLDGSTIDLTKATLKTAGYQTVGTDADNSVVTLGNGTISGTLDLTHLNSLTMATDKVLTLTGDAGGKGLIKVKEIGDMVPALTLAVSNGDFGGIEVANVDTANFAAANMTVGDGATLTLATTGTGDLKQYQNIGKDAPVSVAHSGKLVLAGQNVGFSLGDKYNETTDGALTFEKATAARKLKTDKASFERGANHGGFDIGTTTAYDKNNIFEITDTENDPLDISGLLVGGSFNTAKITGDGWLKTAAAVIGSAYNDTRIGLLVDKLSSVAETISIGGLVTVAKEIAFDTAKTLNLTTGGLLKLGIDADGQTTTSTFNLKNTDVTFTGGTLEVASNASVTDISEELNPATLTVKSLNFASDAGAGSLTIKSGAQVRVVGDASDDSKRYFNANGNETLGLVTLDGAGAKLIVDAKDLLKADASGNYTAVDKAGVIGGYGTLKINHFLDLARHDQNLAANDNDKPRLDILKFIEMRQSLEAAGTTTGNPYNVLIEFDKDDVEGFFDKDGNINREDSETKKWLDNGMTASGNLVYGVEKDNQSSTDKRQEWGAAKNTDNNDTLIIGKDTDTGEGTSKDVTLDNAGAGVGDKATDKNYFVRYDDTTDAANPKKDELGNIKFVEDEAKGTLIGGGVIGSVSEKDGVKDADLIFKDGKAAPDFDPDNKKGFASGSIDLPNSNVTGDHADVIIGLTDKSPENADRDAGNLTSKDLIVKNDSSFTVKGTSDIENLKFGNDAAAGYDGSTNKVDFKGKADIDNIIADGAQVSKDKDGNPIGGASGDAKVTFNDTDDNTVGTVTVAGDNSLSITGKADVTRKTTVAGSLTVDENVKLKGRLDVIGTADKAGSAFVKSGALNSKTQVGGAAGNGFLYLGSTQDTMESPNTIGKNWADSEAALKERQPGTSYTGIGYLDKNGYDISNATINIGSVTGGAERTLTVGTGGALIVTDQALTAPADGQWNYTAGMKGNIANEGGTVLIGDLNKIGNKTTIKLADGTVTGTADAVWITKNPLYTLTLKDDGILYASFNSTASDAITGKVDKDLADIIKDQGNKDQNQGGGFDKDRKDGNGFISKVLDDTVTNENGVDFDATADRIGKTLTSSTRFAVLGGAAQNSQLASDMVTAQIEERAGFRTSTASRMTTDNGEAGSLWVNPLYNKNRSGHLNAGHYTYGLDADLYGMSFGGDVAVNDTFRIGAAFSGGKGNSDAVGGLMPTKNDFDFYSGSLYAITDIGSVTLLTDLDYTWLKGDVKQTNRITTLNSTLKSDVTSFGVSAKRTFEVNNGTLVAPYAGVRVNRLHINGYDVKDTDGNTIITAESQQQYYATVPVGVQVSKNIELTNGFVKPVLDLGLVTTLGSRHMESRVTYTGFGETSATSEVRDRTAFTVKFGVNAEVGNLGLGLGYGLTGSQSLTSNQVYGNIRYRF